MLKQNPKTWIFSRTFIITILYKILCSYWNENKFFINLNLNNNKLEFPPHQIDFSLQRQRDSPVNTKFGDIRDPLQKVRNSLLK